jgi:hypothetical protein
MLCWITILGGALLIMGQHCAFMFLPCASHPSRFEKQRQAKGAAYNDLVTELLKQVSN